MDQDQIKKGTTTVGLVCKDGVVLAADSRAAMGNLIANKTIKKVLPITDRILLTIAGAAGDGQMLVRFLANEMKSYEITKKKKPSIKACASLLSQILFSGRMSFIPYYVQLILAGYDDKGPSLITLDAGGSIIEDDYASTGSGSPVAYGVLQDAYKKGLSLDEGIKLAARAVSTAIQRDVFTGEEVNVYTVTEKGIKQAPAEKIKA